jgi:hypothetical protein
VTKDYRSDRMESPEGRGVAKRAWDSYVGAVSRKIDGRRIPIVSAAAEPVVREHLADLLGFWVLWHLYGGFEGLERYGFHRATIYRKVKRFRDLFGVHPDEYEMPGIEIDRDAYWSSATKKVGRRPS